MKKVLVKIHPSEAQEETPELEEELIDGINITEKIKAFCEKYYNNYSNTTIEANSDDFDTDVFYANLGEVANEEAEIDVNGETYDQTEQSISIGNNGFIKAPLWKIEDKILYVSTFLLGINTASEQIVIKCGDTTKTITDVNSIPATSLGISEVYALNTQEGYKNEVSTTDNNTDIVQNTEHGLHAVGLVIQDEEGEDILDESIYYLYSSELSMGISTPETMDEKEVTFAIYGKYSTEPYTEEEERIMNITIFIPDKGIAKFKLTVNIQVKSEEEEG